MTSSPTTPDLEPCVLSVDASDGGDLLICERPGSMEGWLWLAEERELHVAPVGSLCTRDPYKWKFAPDGVVPPAEVLAAIQALVAEGG